MVKTIFTKLIYKVNSFFSDFISSMFFTQEHDKLVVTDAEVEAYYEKNKDSMKETITKYGEKMIDVRHILLQPKDKTDAALAACLAEAEALLQQWKDGEATEESFEIGRAHV